MVKNILCCIIVAVVCAGCMNVEVKENSTCVVKECRKSTPLLRHVLLFKFKETTTPEQIKEVENNFASLQGKIDAIKCFEWGTNISPDSPSNRTEGFTHCFEVTFADKAGLDEYLNHPDLKAFRKSLAGLLEKYVAVDYWTNR